VPVPGNVAGGQDEGRRLGVDCQRRQGPGAKDQVVVVGDTVDSVKLTSALHKKVGTTHLVQVADAAGKKVEQNKPAAPAPATAPEYQQFYCHYPAPQPATVVYEYPATGYAYGYQCRSANTCSIMWRCVCSNGLMTYNRDYLFQNFLFFVSTPDCTLVRFVQILCLCRSSKHCLTL
jgi:hypothetical protein